MIPAYVPPVHGFVQDTGLDLGEKCPKKILICCGEILEEMALDMGLYCFFKCGMYCTNILLSIFWSILCANIDQQGEGLRTERASSSKFSICFTHVHIFFYPCSSIFPHFHQHVAPRELGSCIFFVKNPLAGVRQQERSCRCKMHSVVKAGSTQTNNGWVQRCSCLRA